MDEYFSELDFNDCLQTTDDEDLPRLANINFVKHPEKIGELFDLKLLQNMLERANDQYCKEQGRCVECGEKLIHAREDQGFVGDRRAWENIYFCPNGH